MILVDTSVWVDHLRNGERELENLLATSQVLVHPFIIGELACGNLSNREEILGLLGDLPVVQPALDSEVLITLSEHQLMGKGIGYIDAHLITSVLLHSSALLWTKDRRLATVASSIGIALPR